MSIESLCQGDVVIKQTQTASTGATMGVSENYADGTEYDCTIQVEEDGALGYHQFAARGQKTYFKVYFSEDVQLTPDHRLKWTVEANTTLGTPKIMRVVDYYKEGRPGEDMLWIADCDIIDTRLGA